MRSHSADLFKFNNYFILPVRGLYILQTCCFIRSCITNSTHSAVDFNLPSHQYCTRTRNMLCRPTVVTNTGERSLSFRGVQFYNFFNEKFNAQNLNANMFKKQIKCYLCQPVVIDTLLKSTNIF